MLTLFLIRHAKSSWAEQGMDDFDRPLNARGLENAPFMGKQLAARGELPQWVVSSTANRAITTARLVTARLNYAFEDIHQQAALYHASVPTWLKVVNGFDPQYKIIMAFGHNNGITGFANYLTGGDIANIPTCGIVKIMFDIDDWALVSQGMGTMVYFDYPKRYSENLN